MNLEQDVESPLEQARARVLAPETTEIQRRQVLITAVREAAEQVLPTRVTEEQWDMVLKRRFKASRRAQMGDLPDQAEPLRMARKNGVHVVQTKKRMH